MKPSDIRPGRKYRLVPLYTPLKQTLIREVIRIDSGQVIVHSITGKEVPIPLREFAAMAREEVS